MLVHLFRMRQAPVVAVRGGIAELDISRTTKPGIVAELSCWWQPCTPKIPRISIETEAEA